MIEDGDEGDKEMEGEEVVNRIWLGEEIREDVVCLRIFGDGGGIDNIKRREN